MSGFAAIGLSRPKSHQNVGGVMRDILYGGAISLVSSPNASSDWTDISFTLTPAARMHNDQHAMAANPFRLGDARRRRHRKFADNFLDDVFRSHKAKHFAIFIDDDGHALAAFLEIL